MTKPDNRLHAVQLCLVAIMLIGLIACTTDDATSQQSSQGGAPVYSIRIPATFGENLSKTRAVNYNSETGALDATFTTDDIIFATIVSAGDNQAATTILKPDNNGNSVNLVPYTGSIVSFHDNTDPDLSTNPTLVSLTGGETIFLEYHSTAINEFFDYTGLYTDPFGVTQNGTLAGLSLFDYATATVQVTGITGNETDGYALTTTNASFNNQQSMFKFTFTGLPSGVGVKKVVIHSSEDKLVTGYSPTLMTLSTSISMPASPILYGDITIDLGTAASASNSTVYAALRFDPLDNETATDNIIFTITGTDNKTYTTTKTSPAGGFQNGKYYSSTVALPTYRVYTAQNVYTNEQIPSDATKVTSTGPTSWGTGTYVVSDDVTITNGVNLTGDVKLILMDGASLTVKRITSSDEGTLSVYGQSAGTGKLMVDNTNLSDPNYSAMTVNGLTVHGGEIEVKAARSNVNYLVGGVLSSGPVTVYNGKVTATSDNGCGIRITYNHLIVYDGEVNITSKGDAILLYNDNNLTHTDLEIKGGSVTAKSTVGSGVHIKSGKGDKITIDGGLLTAIGGEGNGGADGYGIYIDPWNKANIQIESGTLDVTGGNATTRRDGRPGISIWGDISVEDGTFTVKGGEGSDDRNGGHGIYFKTAGLLTVNGGTVDVTGSKGANGINGSVSSSIQAFNGGQSSITGGEGSKAFNRAVKIKSGLTAYCSSSTDSPSTLITGEDQNVTLSYRYVNIK